MKLSVIVATKNRALALTPCLDSIAAAFASAAPVDAEIVVVDNGSTDDTADTIKTWAGASAVPVQSLSEPRAGKSGGAFCMRLRGGESRILSNFKPGFGEVSTLAHRLASAFICV